MRKRAYLYLILSVALAGFIVFTSTNSGAAHNALGGRTIAWINAHIFGGSLIKAECDAIVGVAAKLFGHFSLFLLDGLFFRLFLLETKLSKRMRLILFFGLGFALSATEEIVQIFSEGRYPSVFDVVLDFSGFILPAVFMFFLNLNKADQ